MKIAAGIGLVILFFVIIARASITSHFYPSPETILTVALSPSDRLDIYFDQTVALKNIAIPSFDAHSLRPTSPNWKSTTTDPIIQYLKSHNEKVLQITGYFLNTERDIIIGGSDSMGAARAGFIASELMKQGISAPRIVIKEAFSNSETLSTALKFEFFNDGENIP